MLGAITQQEKSSHAYTIIAAACSFHFFVAPHTTASYSICPPGYSLPTRLKLPAAGVAGGQRALCPSVPLLFSVATGCSVHI